MVYVVALTMIFISFYLTGVHYRNLLDEMKENKRPKSWIVLQEFFWGPGLFYMALGLIGFYFLLRGKFGP